MPREESRTTCIDIQQEGNIIEAAEAVRMVAARLGMSNTTQYMVATAASELATNICRYAEHGFISARIINSGNRQGIEIIAEDSGPGIVDLELALSDNFSTSGSLGVGLPGTRRLVDDFEIESKTGRGTLVTIRTWL